MRTLLTLAIVGVAVKLFLDTDTGKDVVRRLKDVLAEAQEELQDTLATAKDKMQSTANRVGNGLASDVRENF